MPVLECWLVRLLVGACAIVLVVKNGKNENQVWRLWQAEAGCHIEQHNDRSNDDKGLIPVSPLLPFPSLVVGVVFRVQHSWICPFTRPICKQA